VFVLLIENRKRLEAKGLYLCENATMGQGETSACQRIDPHSKSKENENKRERQAKSTKQDVGFIGSRNQDPEAAMDKIDENNTADAYPRQTQFGISISTNLG